VVDVAPVIVDEVLVEKDCALTFHAQNKSNWCWAAVSQMMRQRYKGEVISQCKIASSALFDADTIDCCLEGNDGVCNEEHALVLVGLDSTSSGQNTALSFAAIKGQIDADRPFIFAKRHHYLIAYGYGEGTHIQELHVWDPLPVGVGSKTVMSYADYKQFVEDGGENFYDFVTTD
jgi:hypothetical protein